ncbi:MAG: ATP F0F1 synthase subunit B [Geminicoccaceae bacterium]|nr:MAG: ATP F0F1 synthase subunit B [Geminicoccaceae bacterium]
MAEDLVKLAGLLIFLALIWRPASRFLLNGLDARSARIKDELEQAHRLREEAQSMLAKYQRELHEGEARAQAILRHAEEEAARQERLMREKLETAMQRRTKQAMDRIATAEARALQDIRAQAAMLSVRATESLLKTRLDGEQAKVMLHRSLDEVRSRLA